MTSRMNFKKLLYTQCH